MRIKLETFKPVKDGYLDPQSIGITLNNLFLLRQHYQAHVLLVLGFDCNEHGVWTGSAQQIAKELQISPTTAMKALRGLAEHHFISILDYSQQSNGSVLSDYQRWQVFKRDNYTCIYCGTDNGPFEVDHIIPVKLGGSWDYENLGTSCTACNRKKSSKLSEE